MRRGPDLSVGAWLTVGFGAAALLLVALVALAGVLLGRIDRAERTQSEVIEPRAQAAAALEEALLRLGIAARTYALTRDARHLDAYRAAADEARRRQARLEAMDPAVARGHAETLALVAPYREQAEAFVATVSGAPVPPASAGLREAELALTEHREAALARLSVYLAEQQALSRTATDELLALQRGARAALLAALASVLAVLAATARFVAHGVRRPALELVEASRRLAEGDPLAAAALASPPDAAPGRRNELRRLGQAFGRMAVDLHARDERIADQQGRLQRQHEELQAQHEELQAQQEELQLQNEELQAQQEELQSQADELRQHEDALRDADRRKDEFLAVLSHELRNPLAPIVSGLEVMDRAGPGSDAAGRARAVIGRQIHHLVRLVDDLLDVTRITRGKVSLRRAPVDLAAVVRHACEDNAAAFAGREVALDVAVAPAPLWLDADPARITQIVGNLLQNAAKFTPPGGRVTVSAEAREGRAVLRVRDTGVGIAPEVLPKLFQPFIQAEASLARTSGGLGLGLALVRGLAELHGGTARAESAGEGKGAEFTVELPLAAGGATVADPRAGAAGPRRRVLVIEDQADAAESLADLLRLAGHAVEVARDGLDGLRRAGGWRPDAVLCDVGLPGIDGYEVARRLRADGHATTLLVALTGYALPEDLRRAREAGFDAHLTKPASPEELEGVLASREPLRGDP